MNQGETTSGAEKDHPPRKTHAQKSISSSGRESETQGEACLSPGRNSPKGGTHFLTRGRSSPRVSFSTHLGTPERSSPRGKLTLLPSGETYRGFQHRQRRNSLWVFCPGKMEEVSWFQVLCVGFQHCQNFVGKENSKPSTVVCSKLKSWEDGPTPL